MSEQSKKKISDANKGRKRSIETRRKMSESAKLRALRSEEIKQKLETHRKVNRHALNVSEIKYEKV